VRRYRTEGEEIKLIDAYVEFVLCGKMPNLKIVNRPVYSNKTTLNGLGGIDYLVLTILSG
jgi:hypothetical protein